MRQADQNNQGWHDSQSHLTMILINEQGEERIRKISSRALEVAGDGEKRLITFEFPPNLRGTAFLSYSHINSDDDQWLYLPNLKKIKRIASRSKSDAFMGSEFSYEDIVAQPIEKYHYRWLRDEPHKGKLCFVIESIPVDIRYSGYSRRVSWLDQAHDFTYKTDFYDRNGHLLKTLTFEHQQFYLNTFWRPDAMTVINHQNGKKTRMLWQDYQFQTGLTDEDFSQRTLQRGN